MHRSGTSAVVGSLQQHGLFLGRHSTYNVSNKRGNRENPDVRRLNEDILAANGGSWHDPPPRVSWTQADYERARELLRDHASHPVWGFKDPRTLLTFEGWLALVPDIELVGVFRHPARVVRSLGAREGLPVQDPVGVWERYNRRLLELRRERTFPLLCFDDDSKTFARKVEAVARELGLEEAAGDEPFFTSTLRRMDPPAGELPASATALYDELVELSLSPAVE